ncbi:MAG: pyridoxamine 5'-phosphate oxidase family protein [Gammaproteobacteria bacterium]
MKGETLQAAVDLARSLKHVFVATADCEGMPHVAAAADVVLAPENRVAVQEWFCPGTVRNVSENPFVSIVVWDAESDKGYQLLGVAEKIKDLAVLDGYVPGINDKTPLPQIQRQLLIRVDRILEFTHRPHTDLEEC